MECHVHQGFKGALEKINEKWLKSQRHYDQTAQASHETMDIL